MDTMDLDALAARAQALQKPTGELNELLKKAEEALRGLALGVSATVIREGVELTWSKRGGAWALCARHVGCTSTPILFCSREVRAKAALHLRDLLAECDVQIEHTAVQLAEGIAATEGFLELVEDYGKEPER